jgi:hypothetical protein
VGVVDDVGGAFKIQQRRLPRPQFAAEAFGFLLEFGPRSAARETCACQGTDFRAESPSR